MCKETGRVMLSELKAGEVFRTDIGEFIILEHEQEAEVTKVIQKNLFAEGKRFGKTANYRESALKKYFEDTVEPAYIKEFGEALMEHEADVITVDNQRMGTFVCKIRPLSFDEARKYNDLLVNTELPNWYWTCSPWSTPERGWKNTVAVVSPSGGINRINGRCSDDLGVRPFCILKSNLFVSKVEE